MLKPTSGQPIGWLYAQLLMFFEWQMFFVYQSGRIFSARSLHEDDTCRDRDDQDSSANQTLGCRAHR